MGNETTSAMVLGTFRGDPELPPGAPTEMDDLAAEESSAWQAMSNRAANATTFMMPWPWRRVHKINGVEHEIPSHPARVPHDPNRVLEVHGLMGAIGEQLGLALTADLDARRLIAEARKSQDMTDQDLVYRLRIRAMSEMSAYFTLGAAHSLANLVVRILLLHPEKARDIDPQGTKYPPGDDGRKSWDSLNRLSKIFKPQVDSMEEGPLRRLVNAVITLQMSTEFQALDERRGMDFHRRRPQSVEHTAPTAGIYTSAEGVATLRMPSASLQPEADAIAVHTTAQAALHEVTQAMNIVRGELGPALRDEGFTYIW